MIRGKVRNEAGQALAQVIVDLESGSGGARIGQAVTNNEGDFAFSGLGETSYIVVINHPDYQPYSETIQFTVRASENRAGETQTLFVTLTGKPGAVIPKARTRFVQDVPPDARSAFERAERLSRDGKRQEAIAALGEATRSFPGYFDARFMLGYELLKAGRLDEAIAELERARSINPKDDRVFLVFGWILNQQRKYAVAAAVFGEAARMNAFEPQYPLLRATALIDQAGQLTAKDAVARDELLSAAEGDLGRASALSRTPLAAVYLQRARVYEKRKEPARAANELEEYLKRNPKAPNAAEIREAIKKLRAPHAETAP
jgi:type IV pilus assembly protein PilF